MYKIILGNLFEKCILILITELIMLNEGPGHTPHGA